MRKLLANLIILSFAASFPVAQAQDGPPPSVPAQAPPQPDAVPLYGDQNPGQRETELWSVLGADKYFVRNVTYPTLTPFLPPAGTGNGAAVVVAPGGAFMGLAVSHEGWDVATALADRGIAAFVLQYRLVETPVDNDEANAFMGRMVGREIGNPMEGQLLAQSKAPDDGRAALAMVREQSAQWGIDRNRVGMIGFSAGAMTSRRVALDSEPGTGPDFIGYIYGPQDGEPVAADAPPMFAAIAVDDALFPTKGFPIVGEWLKAGVPVELHAYGKGNHGFGLGLPGTTTTGVIDQFVAWLDMQGFLEPKDDR